jgi:WD40 repeat protein
MLLSGHTERLTSAAFSADGARIVTSSFDKTARVWNAATGQQLMLLSGPMARVNSAGFSPDGSRIVTAAYDNMARVWDAATRRQTALLEGHADRVWSAAFSPDGTRVVTSSFDKSARIWDAASGRQLALLSGHTNLVATAAFSADGMRIVTASNDSTARVWDAATGREIMLLSGPARVWCAAFSPDGQRVATASDDNTALIWDSATGRQLLQLKGHKGRVLSVAFSPDGRRLVTASLDKTARLWDAETGREILQLSGHGDVVNTAAFSRDGARVVTASDDKTARIWDAATGRELVPLRGHGDSVNAAAFSPDGTRIATASLDRTARIWDAATGRELLAISGHTEMIETVAFSPDGWHIVTASDDRTARIWNAQSPPLDDQIVWAHAAQFDPLPVEQRFQLGMPAPIGVRQWPNDRSPCDEAAAAPYDPDRRAAGAFVGQIVSDTALAACADLEGVRALYQRGRALMANGNLAAAASAFEAAVARGYRAARVDEATLRAQPAAGMLDVGKAVALYEQAWTDGVTIAAFELGQLYEQGIRLAGKAKGYALAPDATRAWVWYQKGAAAREPSALARLAQRQEDVAASEADAAEQNSLLLESFRSYAAAAERARSEDWPDEAWRSWRYRRASIARLLERESMTAQVAAVYREVRDQYGMRSTTLREALGATFRPAR